jgi:ABC-2 type transport system ATP-binding protein
MLELIGFKKYYKEELILGVDSLVLPSGIHWLQGRNGSGKSTFLRSVAGLIPFEGEIRLNEYLDPVKTPVDYRCQVNYAESEPLFPGFLCGKEILQFTSEMKKAKSSQMEELVEIFGLSAFFEKPASSYSSGMTKKVSLAMAFLGDPALILLDEPFITLDTESFSRLSSLIRYKGKDGISFLISSHPDFNEAGFTGYSTYRVENQKITRLP